MKMHIKNYLILSCFAIVALIILSVSAPNVSAFTLNELAINIPSNISTNVVILFQSAWLGIITNGHYIEWEDGTAIDDTPDGSNFTNTSTSFAMNNVFPNVTIEYNVTNNQTLKEVARFDAKPYTTALDDFILIGTEIGFDDSAYGLYANGAFQPGDFETNGSIHIADSTMPRITLPRPFAYDSNGTYINLTYSLDYQSVFGFFEHWYLSVKIPTSFLDSAVYPVYVDPTAITGCSESATEILCSGGTFSGNFIHTTKNITIISATINGVNVDGGAAGQVILNSTQGNITIFSSTINAQGSSLGAGNPGLGGEFIVLNAPKGFYVTSSTINSYGGGGACNPGNGLPGGSGTFDSTGLIGNSSYSAVIINSYGGDGCGIGNGNVGNGGSGNYNSYGTGNNATLTVTASSTINSYGGAGAIGGSSGSPIANGGNGVCTLKEYNLVTNGISNLTLNCYGGSVSGSVGTRQGGDGRLSFIGVKTVNASIYAEYSGACTGGPCSSGGSQLSITPHSTNRTRIILRDNSLFNSQGTGGSIGGSQNANVMEFTLLNNSALLGNQLRINSSSDIFRIGIFNSTGNNPVLNYDESFGIFILNGTATVGSGAQLARNFTNYYFPIHKITSPSNNGFATPGDIQFNATYYSEYYTPLNMTFYVWHSNGTLYNQTTVVTNGEINFSSATINITQNGVYLWNARLTSSAMNLQEWWNVSNYTLSIGSTINNQTYASSAYETSTQPFSINLTEGGSSITSGQLVYKSTPYSATVSTVGPNVILSRSIDIPTGVGSQQFYWNLTYASGDSQSTPITTQTVLPINLTICGGSQNVSYINFTFADENTGASINASTDAGVFNYNIGGGTQNKTLLYQNAAEIPSYAYCFTPSNLSVNTSVSYQYSATNYPARTFVEDYILTNTTTNKTLYLLSSSDGLYVTFQTVNNLGTPLTGVQVTASRDISGTETIVGEGTTDSAGTITFWLNPNIVHTISASGQGCTSTSFSVTPTQSVYTITLSCTGDQSYSTSPIAGIAFQKTPPSGVIVNGTTNFQYSVFTLTSNVSIVKAKFELGYFNGTVISTNETLVSSGLASCTSTQCNLSIIRNVAVGDELRGRYFVDVGNGYVLLEGAAQWRSIRSTPEKTTTLKYFFSDLKDIFEGWTTPTCSYSDDGLQGTNCTLDALELQNKLEYSRLVFFFLVFAILISVLGKATGYDGSNPGIFIYLVAVVIIILSLVGGLSGEGFFYYSNLTPFHFINNYILAFTMLMVSIGYYCMLSRRQT